LAFFAGRIFSRFGGSGRNFVKIFGSTGRIGWIAFFVYTQELAGGGVIKKKYDM
jgi:hypothetical protein